MFIRRNADIMTSKRINNPDSAKRIFIDTQISNSFKDILANCFSKTFFKKVYNLNVTF